MNHVINAENMQIEISAVRLVEVSNSYLTLRQVDAQESQDGCKYIILDMSTDVALRSILQQVSWTK